MRSRTSGFNLIELLVVIAIIAILMSIIMPALSKAKEQAQAVACQGNLKGYSLAIAMYAQDHDDNFPNPRKTYFYTDKQLPGESASGSRSYIHQRWYNSQVNLLHHPEFASEFFKYLANAKALICPTFKRLAKHKGARLSGTVTWEGVQDDRFYDPWHNYTMNAYLGPKGANALVAKLSQVRNPANVFVFADEGPYAEANYNNVGLNDTQLWVIGPGDYVNKANNAIKRFGRENVKPGPASQGRYGTFTDIIGGFHNAPSGTVTAGKGNVTFADGHVGPVARDDSFIKAWPK